MNRTVGVDYVQVESCADGVALAQLLGLVVEVRDGDAEAARHTRNLHARRRGAAVLEVGGRA